MRRRKRLVTTAAFIVAAAHGVRAQDSSTVHVTLDDRGLTFAAPGRAMEATIRFYIQPLVILQADDDAGALRHITLQLRRARLGFTGSTFDPRLRFNFQMGFGRQETETESVGGTSNANIVADANVVWNWTPNCWTMVGQGKIFGDRQGINPAGELEFPDRSLVFMTFGPDRDAGVMAAYTHNAGKGPLMVRGSVTAGEGRNSTTGGTGLMYGARVDWQPFGAFKGTGAFSESDLQREPDGRFAIGASYSYNVGATRVGGTTGTLLVAPRDIRTTFVDAIWKRRGVAVEAEYALREANDALTTSGTTTRAVFAGYGASGQASYVMNNGLTPAVRVSSVVPDAEVYGAPNAQRRTQMALELARYLRGHRLKWQLEFGRDEFRDPGLRTKTAQLYARWGVMAGL